MTNVVVPVQQVVAANPYNTRDMWLLTGLLEVGAAFGTFLGLLIRGRVLCNFLFMPVQIFQLHKDPDEVRFGFVQSFGSPPVSKRAGNAMDHQS